MKCELIKRLDALSTPHLADACHRVGIKVRCAPGTLRPLKPTMHCAGKARPVRHVGSADLFFEALEASEEGDILVIDDGGSTNQACVGDLVTLEMVSGGMAGIVI